MVINYGMMATYFILYESHKRKNFTAPRLYLNTCKIHIKFSIYRLKHFIYIYIYFWVVGSLYHTIFIYTLFLYCIYRFNTMTCNIIYYQSVAVYLCIVHIGTLLLALLLLLKRFILLNNVD